MSLFIKLQTISDVQRISLYCLESIFKLKRNARSPQTNDIAHLLHHRMFFQLIIQWETKRPLLLPNQKPVQCQGKHAAMKQNLNNINMSVHAMR